MFSMREIKLINKLIKNIKAVIFNKPSKDIKIKSSVDSAVLSIIAIEWHRLGYELNKNGLNG